MGRDTDALGQRSGWGEVNSHPRRHPQQLLQVVRPRLEGSGVVATVQDGCIFASVDPREKDMSEYDAARIFLEKPTDPRSEHGRRLAEALARTYSISPDEVRDIWATRAFRPGKPNGHKLSQLQTDGYPNFFPDQQYPDPADLVPREVRPRTDEEDEEIENILNPRLPPLWGPRTTTMHMEMRKTAAELAGDGSAPPHPEFPAHKLHQRLQAGVKTQACARGDRPPVGHIDITVIECLNLAVPHKFKHAWNISSIAPMVQVEVVERGRNGVEMLQFLSTTAMSRSKMAPFRRSPIDAVFNETCRFQALHLNALELDAVASTNFLVSVLDKDSNKCLGSVTITAEDILRKRGAPFYTWYELMKPAPDNPSRWIPVAGSDPTKLSCIQLGFWSNPIPEHVARDVLDMTARRASVQVEGVFALYKEALAVLDEDALAASLKQTPADVEHGYQNVRERLVTLDANMQRLADEKSRLADEEAALASEEARLQTRQQAHSARKLDTAVERTSPGATGANQPLAGNPTGWTHATAADSDSANGLEVSARDRRPSDDARMQSEAPPVVRLAVPEYEETLRPWMAVKDVGDLILNRELILGARRRRWTLDLVPGALGILQGLVAGGYEVVLTCKASPEQAEQTLRVLRTIGLVGGAACAVKEEHVVFARSYKDKEVLVQAMGGWACAVDDDWYMLKRAAALGTGMHLVLFNPDPDTEAEYKDDAKKWLAYRQALLAQVSKMGALQLAIRSGNQGMAQAAADELRRVEEAALPQLLHLHDWEPSRISCVPLETVAESALTRMHPATSAVRPWLKVAKALGLADADAFLATLAATDSATPRTNAAGELLGYALHRGRAQAGGGGEPAVPAPKPPVGSVAEAGMFHPVVADPSMTSTTSADDEMGPFFPLDELGGGGEGLSGAAKLRLGAWEAGLLSSFDRMGVGLDFYIEPTEDLGEGRWALQTIMVSRVMPGGPAARSGAIEKGMALVSVDGVRCDQPAVKAREVLAARLAAFDKSADGQCAARLQSFRSLRWAQLSQTAFAGIAAADLARAGLFLAADGQVRCRCCDVLVPGVDQGDRLADVLRRVLPASCPLAAELHLKAVEDGSGTGVEDRPADMLPEHLCSGLILGFLPPRPQRPSVSEAGLAAADLEQVVFVWLRPEPVAPMLPPDQRGRVLVDIDRVVLRLRYFDVEESAGEAPRYRDPWGGALLSVPTSAYTWGNLEEVMDSQGRLIFVDHASKTTSFEPPALLKPASLAARMGGKGG